MRSRKCSIFNIFHSHSYFHQSAEGKVAEIYWKTEQRCRLYTKNMTYYHYMHQTMFVPHLFYAIYNVSVNNYDVSTWTLPFNIVVPFNDRAFSGWCLKWFIQFHMALCYAICLVSTTSYFLCCCMYISAICDHFDVLMGSVQEQVDRYRETSLPLEQSKITQNLKDNLIKAVQIHVKSFEYVFQCVLFLIFSI